MSEEIEIDDYTGRGAQGAIDLASAFIQAVTLSMQGTVTYVHSGGELVAAVSPPEAAERYEHAGNVEALPGQREESVPVATRGQDQKRRRTFLGI